MSTNLARVIQDRDGAALAKMAGTGKSPDKVVNDEAEKLVDVLFKNLKQVFPAAVSTTFRDPSDEVAAKRQWIAAFAENSIRTKEQLSAGMRQARASASPFWPSPGQFVQWCKQGEALAIGLPTDDELYDMFRDYCAHRGWREYKWQSNACYWMVTRVHSEMLRQNLTDSEVKKLCGRELGAMVKRIQAGEKIPEPVIQIEEKYTPTDSYESLRKIYYLKEMLKKTDLSFHEWLRESNRKHHKDF
ncbi:replication protein P [Xenorhabdus griffiniae]|uniref:Replication protein P n=1 Tax=Xenorhabdus griffiniae TaxID=351672 RepID=A0ABY9XM70_9GAMM|nr:replication protein P [Xenorhabdus griffiniae]MBD1229354.1 DNA replication protein [Xenorhabdus griffiniae]MBE8589105.1 DNA replication protein [Xenorhabdus griffiniae]WMV74015.1 replication protein P [Xenorhabdus griffiniae]WNH03695.1 replication protein P [Xenorhabdus griffiniae]